MVGPMASFGRHTGGPASSGGGLEVTYDYFPAGFSRWVLGHPEW